jgi:hypothetical protein
MRIVDVPEVGAEYAVHRLDAAVTCTETTVAPAGIPNACQVVDRSAVDCCGACPPTALDENFHAPAGLPVVPSHAVVEFAPGVAVNPMPLEVNGQVTVIV